MGKGSNECLREGAEEGTRVGMHDIQVRCGCVMDDVGTKLCILAYHLYAINHGLAPL